MSSDIGVADIKSPGGNHNTSAAADCGVSGAGLSINMESLGSSIVISVVGLVEQMPLGSKRCHDFRRKLVQS